MPIYYESRISKLSLNAAELPKLDAEFEEITEGEELTKKEKLKSKWAALEALVAADMVAHIKKRLRVRGIGPKTLESLRPFVKLEGEAEKLRR